LRYSLPMFLMNHPKLGFDQIRVNLKTVRLYHLSLKIVQILAATALTSNLASIEVLTTQMVLFYIREPIALQLSR